MLKKIFLFIGLFFFLGIGVVISIIFFLGDRDLPTGKEGPAAETLTQKIEQAVRLERWKKTAAVSFRFAPNDNRHFRDNVRGYREVIWDSWGKAYKVQYDQHANFLAYANGILLKKEEATQAYKQAYKLHTNDFFWFNPFSQLRAPGTKRLFLQERALLVRYTSGGTTPGDSYLIITNAKGLPIRWQMWVSILPIKGVEFSFEDWQTSATGARFSLLHRSPFLDLRITDLKSYDRYPETRKKDRFAPLVRLITKKKIGLLIQMSP